VYPGKTRRPPADAIGMAIIRRHTWMTPGSGGDESGARAAQAARPA